MTEDDYGDVICNIWLYCVRLNMYYYGYLHFTVGLQVYSYSYIHTVYSNKIKSKATQ